jgi:hypothetical protein
MRTHLVPQALMIRNGPEQVLNQERCPGEIKQPSGESITGKRDGEQRLVVAAQDYAPSRPACSSPWNVYTAGLGPLITAINAGGIGAGGAISEARLSVAVMGVRARLGITGGPCAVRRIALVPKGIHYPLGWHLSAAAVEGMNDAAESEGAVTTSCD